MRFARSVTALFLSSALSTGIACAADLRSDQPRTVDGIETVCTGTTIDTRQNPLWQDYSLRLEFVGADGQYLGNETVTVNGNGQSVEVHCSDPWVLMKLPQGTYRIATDVAEAGHRDVTARIPESGQAHIIVRFPDAGGEVASPVRPVAPGEAETR